MIQPTKTCRRLVVRKWAMIVIPVILAADAAAMEGGSAGHSGPALLAATAQDEGQGGYHSGPAEDAGQGGGHRGPALDEGQGNEHGGAALLVVMMSMSGEPMQAMEGLRGGSAIIAAGTNVGNG